VVVCGCLAEGLGGNVPHVLVVCFRWVAGGWHCNGARVCCSGGGDAC